MSLTPLCASALLMYGVADSAPYAVPAASVARMRNASRVVPWILMAASSPATWGDEAI